MRIQRRYGYDIEVESVKAKYTFSRSTANLALGLREEYSGITCVVDIFNIQNKSNNMRH